MTIGTHPRIWHTPALVAPVLHELPALEAEAQHKLAESLLGVVGRLSGSMPVSAEDEAVAR